MATSFKRSGFFREIKIKIRYFVQKMEVTPKTLPLQYIQRVATVCYISISREQRNKAHRCATKNHFKSLFVMTPISTFENWCCLLQEVCQLLQPSLTFTITCPCSANRAKKLQPTKPYQAHAQLTEPIIEPRNFIVPSQIFSLLQK